MLSKLIGERVYQPGENEQAFEKFVRNIKERGRQRSSIADPALLAKLQDRKNKGPVEINLREKLGLVCSVFFAN